MLNAVLFINRMIIVFFASFALAIAVSLARPAPADSTRILIRGVSFDTKAGFNIAGVVVVFILIGLMQHGGDYLEIFRCE